MNNLVVRGWFCISKSSENHHAKIIFPTSYFERKLESREDRKLTTSRSRFDGICQKKDTSKCLKFDD